MGQSYTKTIVIQVQDMVQMDAMFKAMWGGMNNALVAGDKTVAMVYLNVRAQLKYGPVFDVLIPYMPKIVLTYSQPLLNNISEHIGVYAVGTNLNGVGRIFYIYFLQGQEGLWQLESM
jgi:hypothetical protein